MEFFTLLTSPYVQHLFILIGIMLILSQGFNLSFGLGKLFNLAHIASYAVGAYTTAILSTDGLAPFLDMGKLIAYSFGFSSYPNITSAHPLGFWYCIGASMILSGVFSLLIGAISLRLTQEYFAIGTIAFASVVTAVLINWRGLTRGVLGIPGIPRPELSGLDMYETSSFLLLSSITAFLVLALYYVVFRSSFARALRAQGESEIVAQSLGIHSRKVKTVSFVFSAATAGLAGSYFSYYFSFIDPSSFSFTEMVFVLTVGIVGKPGSFWGVTAATFFLVLLPEPLRFLKIDSSIVGPMRQLLYAILLFIAVAVKRKNLFPMERKV